MVIRAFPSQTEPRKKLKKLKSVKVANLDKLRLSMRRENSRSKQGFGTPSEDGTDSSEPSSNAMSGTSSPNYMKATSSSATKGALQASSGGLISGSARYNSSRNQIIQKSSGLSEKPRSKFSRISVEQCSDPAGVDIPVEIKSGKGLRRVSSLRRTRKLSSQKSMKVRIKYSRFTDVGIAEPGTSSVYSSDFDKSECLNANGSGDQCSEIGVGIKQKRIPERSRSIKLTRLRSIRSSRRKPKSKLGGGAAARMSLDDEMSAAEPRYMKGSSSQEARKNSARGLTRTTSFRPLRILAKIPSLKPRRSRVKKRPECSTQSGMLVDRATCASTLKSSKFPDYIELHPGGRETEGISSFHVCQYSYCSLHGHHHHVPSPPIKEFIAAKRKLLDDQTGKQLEDQNGEEVEHFTSVATTNSSMQLASENPAAEEAAKDNPENAPETEDTGMDFLIKIYAKPRRKWAIEHSPIEDAEVISDYDWKLAELLHETSRPEARQKTLSDGQPEWYQIFSPDYDIQQETSKIEASKATSELPNNIYKSVTCDERTEASIGEEEIQSSFKDSGRFGTTDSEVYLGGDLINILSDQEKYTSLWHLIYQQFISSEASMGGNNGGHDVDEREEGVDADTCEQMNDLSANLSKCSTNLTEDEENQAMSMEKTEFDQNAAIKLVQEALTAILQCEDQPSDQQSIPDQETPLSQGGEHIFTPTASTEESFKEENKVVGKEAITATEDDKVVGKEAITATEDELPKLEQIGATLRHREDEGKMPGTKVSKSYSKLRKMIVTAKFIKTIEKLRKINPKKPRYLCSEQTMEDEKVYLRHLSMKGRKNNEEWMLDYALKQAISRLAPEEQRRVVRLVAAFETFTPEQKDKGMTCYSIKQESTPGIESTTILNKEPIPLIESEKPISDEETLIQKQDGEVSVPHLGVPERSLSEADSAGNHAVIDKIKQDAMEIDSLDSNLESSGNQPRSSSVDTMFEEPSRENEEKMRTPEIPSQFPTQDSEIGSTEDVTTFLFDKRKYQSMWSLIYQEVLSSEASPDSEDGVDGFYEKKPGGQEMNDLVSTQSSNNKDQDEDEDSQIAAYGKHELKQSAAIKFVREAVNAILQRYEQSSDQQFIPDHARAIDNGRKPCISASTYSVEENFEEGKSVEKHSSLEPQEKLHQLETKGEELQQDMESNESKEPQKKISKSHKKFKKAIITAKFINAIERLRKITPQKSRYLHSEAISQEERVYLRHLSMDARKYDEDWMLDYALRQVISKMAPDQQRRVAQLVKAFETVTPKHTGKSVRCYPNNAPQKLGESQQGRSIFDEQVHQTQNPGFLLSSNMGTSGETSRHENHHQQKRAADNTIEQKKAVVSFSVSELSEDNSQSASVNVAEEDPSIEHEVTMRSVDVPPQKDGDSEVSSASDMISILSDKQKYTSLWQLIYQQVVSSEASAKEAANGPGESEQGDEENKNQKRNDLDLNQSSQSTGHKEDENNQTVGYEKQEFDQSTAIKLVKEAINAILKRQGEKSNEQALQNCAVAADNVRDLHNGYPPASTETDSRVESTVENATSSEPEKKQHVVKKASFLLQGQAEPFEVKISQPTISKNGSKLKKLIITTKFLKAMEILRISPQKPQYLFPEVTSEEERVNLRHQTSNQQRNSEEWMLDYALRKVISKLAPDQRKKVALLVDAFQTVTREQKGNSIISRMQLKPELNDDQIVGSELDDSRFCVVHISPKLEDQFILPGKSAPLESSFQEDIPIGLSKFRTEIQDKVLDSDSSNFNIHHHVSPKVSTKEETNSTQMTTSLQEAYSRKDPNQESETNPTIGLFSDTQKQTTMWHLIYQHVKSVTSVETGNGLGELAANEDQKSPGSELFEAIANADVDDYDTSSDTSELTESDAIKLVKEAINNILAGPQKLDDKLLSRNVASASEKDQSAPEAKPSVGEQPLKNLSRGFSKLRELIICKKFMKAMEKKRKPSPLEPENLEFKAVPVAGKGHLKPCGFGQKKSTDDLMLDYALQKVITGLAPVQQRRVAMLVEAFEKVNPALGETNKGSFRIKTESAGGVSTAENTKEKRDPVFKSSQKFNGLQGKFDLKLDEPLATSSSMEMFNSRALIGIDEAGTSNSNEDYMSGGQEQTNDGSCCINLATSDVIKSMSDAHKDTAETPDSRVLQEERRLIDENLNGCTWSDTEVAAKHSEPETLEEEGNASIETNTSLDRERHTNLWSLLVKHINFDASEKMEKQIPGEIDANAQVDNVNISLQRSSDNCHRLPQEVNNEKNTDVHIPKSMSFEFQKQEAIKLVQDALDEMLLPDKEYEDQNMSAISDQDVCNANHGDGGEPSSDTASAPPEEKTFPKEKLPNSCSKLSKVILCKRFIKAMDKMRKLKQQSPRYDVQQVQSVAESRLSVHPSVTSEKKSWEEWMLDHAMQQVVGKLAPAKKKRVALLVQAFETVGSQPEPSAR